MNFEDFKLHIRELLKDEALLWFISKGSEFQSLDELETNFLEFFYRSHKETELKCKCEIVYILWDHQYVMKTYNIAQYFGTIFTEKELVELIV